MTTVITRNNNNDLPVTIIGLTGAAGSGKDTVAAHLCKTHGFVSLAFAAPLKAMLTTIGFPEPRTRVAKEALLPGFDFSYRTASQRLGTEWGRAIDPQLWLKLMAKAIEHEVVVNGNRRIVITDCRFHNELNFLEDLDASIWELVGRATPMEPSAQSHVSEQELRGRSRGFNETVINNSGTWGELHRTIDREVSLVLAGLVRTPKTNSKHATPRTEP